MRSTDTARGSMSAENKPMRRTAHDENCLVRRRSREDASDNEPYRANQQKATPSKEVTYDGGKTWVTSDATPNDPVQRGSICTGGTTCGDDRNLLDFIDVTIDNHGRVEVGYADGCTGACVTDTDEQNPTPTPRSPGSRPARRCSRRTTRRPT